MEMTERPFCPDPEVLGAFAEGTATEEETSRVREHLATCNDCLEEVGELARLAREEPTPNVVPIRPTPARWGGWQAVAAALVVVVGGWGTWRAVIWDPANVLRTATVKANDRVIEPRLYKFPFVDYSAKRDGDGAPRPIEVQAATSQVLLDAIEKPSDKMKHAAAVARLLDWQDPGNVEEGLAQLEQLANKHPDEAANWNDLAAAQIMVADRSHRQDDYTKALDATDRALKLKPDLREALFNRALILDRMERTAAAKDAWQRYLATEKNQAWIEHVRERYLEQLTP